MFKLDYWKQHRLMGIRHVEGADPAAPPAPADPANPPKPEENPANPPKPADPNAPKPEAPPAPPAGETVEQAKTRLEAEVARLEREKADVRIEKEGAIKKEAKRVQLLDVAKVAGIDIKEPEKETVESLTEKLTGKVLQGDETSTELKDAKLELAVYKAAGLPDVRVDPNKLANRVSFIKALSALDLTSDTFDADLKALILAEATHDPSIKSGGTGSTTSGADQYGGAGGGQEITQEAFDKMGIAERTKLFQTNPALHERLSA